MTLAANEKIFKSLSFGKSIGRNNLLFPFVLKNEKFVYCFRMKSHYKRLNTTFGLLLVLFIFSSMFWCGDQDCLNDRGRQSCSAVFCILWGNHDTQDSGTSTSSSDHCACVCNSLITLQDIASIIVHTSITTMHIEHVHNPESPSLSTLYRPPIAA